MIAKAISAEHLSWSAGAVRSHKLTAIRALPLSIFRLTADQSPLNNFFVDRDHDKAVLD